MLNGFWNKLNGTRITAAVLAVLLIGVPVGFKLSHAVAADAPLQTFDADNPNIQYTGRVDFADPKQPKFWSPGVYITARFKGGDCDVLLDDQVLWGNSHNWIEYVVDDQAPVRVKLTGPVNTIHAATSLPGGTHTITICKDTEAGIGYLQFLGLRCDGLARPPAKPRHKMEFIGDSITCGFGADTSDAPCGTGQWYDQHNAYFAYGPVTARALNAQWQLTSVSGIGLVHSCCDMKILMPQVFDKISLSDNALPWDFNRYQPDAVTICLGQNDGEVDPTLFDDGYVAFVKQVRTAYPKAEIFLLDSPMADTNLIAYQKTNLTKVVDTVHANGDSNVHAFFFSRSFNGGCLGHPSLAEHQVIASELTAYLKTALHW